MDDGCHVTGGSHVLTYRLTLDYVMSVLYQTITFFSKKGHPPFRQLPQATHFTFYMLSQTPYLKYFVSRRHKILKICDIL